MIGGKRERKKKLFCFPWKGGGMMRQPRKRKNGEEAGKRGGSARVRCGRWTMADIVGRNDPVSHLGDRLRSFHKFSATLATPPSHFPQHTLFATVTQTLPACLSSEDGVLGMGRKLPPMLLLPRKEGVTPVLPQTDKKVFARRVLAACENRIWGWEERCSSLNMKYP